MQPAWTHSRRVEIVAFFYGAWLAGMMLIQFLLSGGYVSIALGFALVAVPVTLQLWLLGLRQSDDTRAYWYFGLFFVTIFVSLITNTQRINTEIMSQVAGLIALTVVGSLIAQQHHARLLERIFVWVAILLSAVLAIVLIDNDRLWTRLMGRLHSNLWAAVAIAAIPGALALRNRAASLTLAGFVLYMIGFEFNARGPLLYGLATVVAFMVLWAAQNPRQALAPKFQVSAFASAGVALLLVVANWEFIAQNILYLDSATRGLGTGLSGRVALWNHLLSVAADHPFTGVGFRMHTNYVFNPELLSAHNAYIATLVDVGIPGFGLYLLIIGTALWRATIVEKRWLLGAYLIGYALLGLTEARALNVGNPASILFVFTLVTMLNNHPAGEKGPERSSAARHKPLRRATAA